MQFGELIKSLAAKAGVKPDDEFLKKILSFAEVSQLDTPEEFFKPLEQNLLTPESALVDGRVRPKLMAESLNGLDAELDNTVGELPFDDTLKGDIKGIKSNTHEKTRRLTGGIKKLIGQLQEEIKTAKKNPKTEESAKEIENLNKVIESLNREMDNVKVMHKGELENMKLSSLNDKKEFTLSTTLAGKPLPKNNLPQYVNILTATTLVKQEMAKNGLQLSFDDFGNPVIKQLKEGAYVNYFVDNKPVDYNGFIDGVLAKDKFLQINDPQPTNGNGNRPLATGQPGVPTNSAIAQETQLMLDQILGAQV